DLSRLLQSFEEVLNGQPSRFELRFLAKDRTEKLVYGMSHPRCQDGEVIGATVIVVDMTGQRTLELELQRAQRLDPHGRVSIGIAHDFNNMLTVILGSTEQAQELVEPKHPAADQLRRIGHAAEQAANLAGQLLAFSKQRRVACKPVEVNRVARRTLELLRPT